MKHIKRFNEAWTDIIKGSSFYYENILKKIYQDLQNVQHPGIEGDYVDFLVAVDEVVVKSGDRKLIIEYYENEKAVRSSSPFYLSVIIPKNRFKKYHFFYDNWYSYQEEGTSAPEFSSASELANKVVEIIEDILYENPNKKNFQRQYFTESD